MNFLRKKINPKESWEPVLIKFNCLPRISLENLVFSSSVLTSGFPSSLVLKNDFSEVCVYDNNFDLKIGQSKIGVGQNNGQDHIQVITVLNKDQFSYLYTTSMSPKKINIEFNTPMLGNEFLKNRSFTDPIVLDNCTFWINSN